ncbi:MAG: carboxylating nicotinate-nucleotide diphosphorylase [Flavobacteriales bacterium]
MTAISEGVSWPDPAWLDRFIKASLKEDIGPRDHSTHSCIPYGTSGRSSLLIKENAILAGLDLAERILLYLDPELRIERKGIGDGDRVRKGDIVLEVEGHIRSILAGERLILNCSQHMSGIATLTASFVDKVRDLSVGINDTRKTTPGIRPLQKWAVRLGGGSNHRQGLHDMILLKDNHIDRAGGVEKTLNAAVQYLEQEGLDLPIEVEARDLNEVRSILDTARVDRIMLDNFSLEATREAVEVIDEAAIIEASGGITLDTVREYAECGVDRISVGALTHSPPSIDMSFKAST